MEEKRKQAGLLRNSSAKKARQKKEVLENTPGTNIPNRFDAEVVKFAIKWNTTVASLAEWMKMYGETIELVQQIQNPSDEQLNDFVSSADFYGINNKQVLPLLIQAAVLDQKYMIYTTRINITKVDKELAALIRPTWHTGNDPIKLNTLLTSADEGKVSVKVIRGYWFEHPTEITVNMELVLEFIELAKKHQMFEPITPHLPPTALYCATTQPSVNFAANQGWLEQGTVPVTAEQANYSLKRYINEHHVVGMILSTENFTASPTLSGVNRYMGHYLKTELQQKVADMLLEYEAQPNTDQDTIDAYDTLIDGEQYDVVDGRIFGRGIQGVHESTKHNGFYMVAPTEAAAIECR